MAIKFLSELDTLVLSSMLKTDANGVIVAAVAGTDYVSTTGYNNTNWNTAYTYSQVGHLPLAGGTLTGNTFVNAQLGVNTTTINSANKLEVHGQARVDGKMMIGDSALTNTVNTAVQLHIKNTGQAAIRLEDSDSSNLAFDIIADDGVGFVIKETVGGDSGDDIRLTIAETTGNATFAGTVTAAGGSANNNDDANILTLNASEHARLLVDTSSTGGHRATLALESNGNELTLTTTGSASELNAVGALAVNSSATTFAGDITSTGLTVDYTGNRTGDAGILVTNDGSDWGIKVDKDGTTDYGILSQTDGDNAIVVRNAAGITNIQLQGDGDATFAGKVVTTEVESSGALLLDAAADITIDAGGSDIILSDDATIFGTISSGGGSNLQIRSRINNADMFFRGVDGGTEFNALTLDMSAGGNATFAGTVAVNGTNVTVANASNPYIYLNDTNAGAGIFQQEGNTTRIGSDSNTQVVLVQNNATAVTIDTSKNATFAGAGDFGGHVTLGTPAGASQTGYALKLKKTNSGSSVQVGAEIMATAYPANTNGGNLIFKTGNTSAVATTALTIDGAQNATFAGQVNVPERIHIGGATSGTKALSFESTTNAQSYDIDYYNNAGTDTIQGKIRYSEGAGSIGLHPNWGAGAALTLDWSNNATFAGDVTVGGDLIVNGTTTTLNTTTVEVEDNILQLNTTQGSPDTATAATSGISIYRGDGVTQASLIFDDGDDTWDLTNNLKVAGSTTFAGDVTISKAATPLFKLLDTTNNISLLLGADDANTFIRSSSTANVYIQPGGSNAMTFRASGQVGIGTTSPTQALEVHNTIKIGETGVAGGRLISGDSMIFQIDSDNNSGSSSYRFRANGTADDGTELMRIQENGMVGLGTTSPTSFNSRGQNLVVNGTGNTGITISASSTDSSTLLFADGTGGTAAYRGTIEYDHADDSMAISTAAAERLRITSAGAVGIGTTAPGNKLHVKDGASGFASSFDARNKVIVESNGEAYYSTYVPDNSFSGLRFFNSSGLKGYIDYYHGTQGDAFAYSATSYHKFLTASTERMRITSAGNVGIGPNALDTPGGDRLHVDGTLRVGPFFSSSDRDHIKLYPHGTDSKIISPNERFHIENLSGDIILNAYANVGIGTTSPTSKLQVDGGIQMSDDTDTASASKVGTLRYRTSGNNSYVDMCMQTGSSTYEWINILENNW